MLSLWQRSRYHHQSFRKLWGRYGSTRKLRNSSKDSLSQSHGDEQLQWNQETDIRNISTEILCCYAYFTTVPLGTLTVESMFYAKSSAVFRITTVRSNASSQNHFSHTLCLLWTNMGKVLFPGVKTYSFMTRASVVSPFLFGTNFHCSSTWSTTTVQVENEWRQVMQFFSSITVYAP